MPTNNNDALKATMEVAGFTTVSLSEQIAQEISNHVHGLSMASQIATWDLEPIAAIISRHLAPPDTFRWTIDSVPYWWEEASKGYEIDVSTGTLYLDKVRIAGRGDYIFRVDGKVHSVPPLVYRYLTGAAATQPREIWNEAIRIVDTAPLCHVAGKQYVDPVLVIQRMNAALEAARDAAPPVAGAYSAKEICAACYEVGIAPGRVVVKLCARHAAPAVAVEPEADHD